MRFTLSLLAALAMPIAAHAQSDLTVTQSAFDGSKDIIQAPIAANTTGDNTPSLLGFEWTASHPSMVILNVQIMNQQNIFALDLNADGVTLASAVPVAAVTDVESVLSQRTFAIPLAEFNQLAAAHNVNMQVEGDGTNSVSSFNPANATFAPFLAAVGQARG
jgi:hypothetical protein